MPAQRVDVDRRLRDHLVARRDHRHPLVVAGSQVWIGVDVALDEREVELVLERPEISRGLVAEATVLSCEERDLARHASTVVRGLVGVCVAGLAGVILSGSGLRSSVYANPTMPIAQTPIAVTCGNVIQSFTTFSESMRR